MRLGVLILGVLSRRLEYENTTVVLIVATQRVPRKTLPQRVEL